MIGKFMIDVNASLGHWPFAPLRGSQPGELLAMMDAAGIQQAFVASYEGLFYRQIDAANEKLHRSIRRYPERFIHFSVLNPNFPGWSDDLDRAVVRYRTRGIRLFPGYHQYKLADSCCLELFGELERHNLPVQIAPNVTDPRLDHPGVRVSPVDIDSLGDIIDMFPRLRINLLNVNAAGPFTVKMSRLKNNQNFLVDTSWADGVACLDAVRKQVGLTSIAFGTNAPLMYPQSAVYKLREVDLMKKEMDAICRGNALRFLGKRP